MLEHFGQALFITFVEEWDLKGQIETKKFDQFLNCFKSTKDTTWKRIISKNTEIGIKFPQSRL